MSTKPSNTAALASLARRLDAAGQPILVVLCLLLFVLPAESSAQDVESVLASVVRISGTRGGTTIRGSGFVVDPQGDVATIVTAAHDLLRRER